MDIPFVPVREEGEPDRVGGGGGFSSWGGRIVFAGIMLVFPWGGGNHGIAGSNSPAN